MINFLKKINEKKILESSKNGKIVFRKFFNKKEISASGCPQSGSYMARMWRKMLKTIPKDYKVKNILMLGVGGGSAIKEIYKKYKDAYIVGVEYDEIMMNFAKTFIFFKNKKNIELVLDDAVNFISKTDRKFDIIIIDLFNGSNPPSCCFEMKFIDGLKRVLEKDGYILLNYFMTKSLKDFFDNSFSCYKKTKYLANNLAVYKNFGQGNRKDLLPKYFLTKDQSKSYLKAICKNSKNVEVFDNNPLGLLYKIGPLYFEKYCSDKEPRMKKSLFFKIVVWKNFLNNKKEKGWIRLSNSFLQCGVVDLHNRKDDYSDSWSNHAKRHRKRWLSRDAIDFDIVEVDGETFIREYEKNNTIDFVMKFGLLKALEYNIKGDNNNVHLFCVKDKKSNKIVCGLGIIDYPDISLSTHHIAFINDDVRKTSVGFGIMDYWYKYCIKKDIRFLDFGIIAKKRDPKSWNGFSDFKKQFSPYLFNANGNMFIKFVFKK